MTAFRQAITRTFLIRLIAPLVLLFMISQAFSFDVPVIYYVALATPGIIIHAYETHLRKNIALTSPI